MNKVENTILASQPGQFAAPEKTMLAQAQNSSSAEMDARMNLLAQQATVEPSTLPNTSEVYDYNKILRSDVYRNASEWGKSILTSGAAMSNSDFQRAPSVNLARLTNAIKVVESDAFRNAAPSLQKNLARAFLGGIDEGAIAQGLVEAASSPKFQSFDDDTQAVVLGYISRANAIGVHKSALDPHAIRFAIANTRKVFESDGFINASPAFRRHLLDALFTQADSSFLADNLVEITGTPKFQSLDERSQKRIINDVSFALLNRGGVTSNSPKNTPALVEISNIRRLTESDGFNNASPTVRVRMLDMLGQSKRDVNFTNALIKISGNYERFGRLNEHHQITYMNRIREVIDEGWFRGLSSNQLSKRIEKINREIEITLRQSQSDRRVN